MLHKFHILLLGYTIQFALVKEIKKIGFPDICHLKLNFPPNPE